MLIGEIIAVALSALRANKLRSLLTMLGIVIGVGAVITVVALGTGAQKAVKDRIASLGTTLLTVNPGQQRHGGGARGVHMNADDQIVIPVNTARFRTFGTDRLRSINTLAVSEDKIPEAMADIQRVLRRQHRIRPNAPDDFQIRSQTDFLSTAEETT